MSDLYGEFLDALHEVQRTSGLGAIRLGRYLGVSTDMMKSLLTGRRHPGLRTVAFVIEGCEAGLRRVPRGPLQEALGRLGEAAGRLMDVLTGCVEPASSGRPSREGDREQARGVVQRF